MPYPWKELWSALISLIKFMTSNESTLVKKMNIFTVAHQVTVIFNLFITYGDTFLPSPSSYDELYYELVRCHSTFDALYSMALRYSTSSGDYRVSKCSLKCHKIYHFKGFASNRKLLGKLQILW